MPRFYFDHNATTPVSPEAAEEFARALREVYGNASSVHHEGQLAREKLERARAGLSSLIGGSPKELVLTSGGTEADNLAVLGAARARAGCGNHVVTSAIEHPAVLRACAQLESEGFAVTFVPPDPHGVVSAEAVAREIRPETVLVSVMHANNETGVVQPIAEIALAARAAGVAMHSDGVQAVGKLAVDVNALGVDLYSFSGHKFGAPKGVGGLFVRQGMELQPLQFGGRHERGRRPGTENVAGVMALAAAGRWVAETLAAEGARVARLRDRLEKAVVEAVPDVIVNGAGAERVPNTTNLCFAGIEAESLVIALDLKGFAVSTGSACSSGAVEPSHVLIAMGLGKDRARSSVRFSLGRGNTEDQVDRLVEAIAEAVARLRRLSPVYAAT